MYRTNHLSCPRCSLLAKCQSFIFTYGQSTFVFNIVGSSSHDPVRPIQNFQNKYGQMTCWLVFGERKFLCCSARRVLYNTNKSYHQSWPENGWATSVQATAQLEICIICQRKKGERVNNFYQGITFTESKRVVERSPTRFVERGFIAISIFSQRRQWHHTGRVDEPFNGLWSNATISYALHFGNRSFGGILVLFKF